jgi:pimeloyl-ACP methyl ester carboxylesterase
MRGQIEHRLETIVRRPIGRQQPHPLLFVHGAYAGAWCWDEHFLPYFAARGFDCHALSLRGHAGSASADLLDRAGLDDYVADVDAVARQLDTLPVVIGHSMGGAVAERYVAAHAAAGLVLLASVPPYGLLGNVTELCWRAPDLLAQLALVQSGHGHLANLHRLRAALFASDMPLERAIGYFARMQRESQRALLELSGCQSGVRTTNALPLAVIGGQEDGLFLPQATRWTARVRGVRAAILPGLGHTLMLDCRWRTAAEHILDWLERAGLAQPAEAIASREARPGRRQRSGSRR